MFNITKQIVENLTQFVKFYLLKILNMTYRKS